MKSLWIKNIYLWMLAIVFIGVSIHTPLFVWLQTSTDIPSIAKAWKEVLLLAVLILALCIVIGKRRIKIFRSDPIMYVAFGLLAWHGILILFQPFSWSTVAGLVIDTRYIVAFLALYCVVKMYPNILPYIKRFVFIGAIIIVGFGVLQSTILPKDTLQFFGYSTKTIAPYLTIDQDSRFIRINSTLRGPNPLGAYGVIVVAIAGVLLRRHWDDVRYRIGTLVMMAGSLLVLWRSYSRSAYVATVIVIAWLGSDALRALSLKKRVSIAVLGICLVVGGGLLLSSTNGYEAVIHHENPTSPTITKSNDQHLESLESGAQKVLLQPLGAGVGSTGSASLVGDRPLIIENWYLFVAHETGWVGLGGFFVLMGMVLYQLWQRRAQAWSLGLLISGVALSAIGLVLPVWTDDTVTITWWGAAGAFVATALTMNNSKAHPKKIKK